MLACIRFKKSFPSFNFSYSLKISFIQLDINGNILFDSRKTNPIRIKIEKTIPSFKLGLKNIKIGERRKLYIHPNLAFGDFGKKPNELVIYDIEILSE
ncbi:MAG TPA: hypothetical protein ENH96_02030 [Chlamydiae bacterium]|nr:hypothetical protein [Chlamydiota bacterium]